MKNIEIIKRQQELLKEVDFLALKFSQNECNKRNKEVKACL